MGTCPKCGKHIDEVVLEPLQVQSASDEDEVAWAYRCPDDNCAAILGFDPKR
jgi:hypothetical protein